MAILNWGKAINSGGLRIDSKPPIVKQKSKMSMREEKRQNDYAEKQRRYNNRTKSFGEGWGGEPPVKKIMPINKLPGNIKIIK